MIVHFGTVAKGTSGTQRIQYTSPYRRMVEGVFNIPLHRQGALTMTKLWRVVKTIQSGTHNHTTHTTEHLRQFVREICLTRSTPAVDPDPDRVRQGNLRNGIRRPLKDLLSLDLLHADHQAPDR